MCYNKTTFLLESKQMSEDKEKNIKNIYKEMWNIATKMDSLKSTAIFNVDMLLDELHHQLQQLIFFYNTLVQKRPDKDANQTYYNLKTEPKVHQLIYVHLGRGYPKELFDPHWCYVLKHCKTKFLVIPTTSIKETSPTEVAEYYYDIVQTTGDPSRLRLDEIRTIDKMRVVMSKGYKNISTSRSEIEKVVERYLGLIGHNTFEVVSKHS